MKTKTFLLICLFLGIGFTRLQAQTDVYKFQDIQGMMPVSCDGTNVEVLSYVCKLVWLAHSQHGIFTWVQAKANWTATSASGEVFKGREQDPGIEFYDLDGNRTEIGTLRVVLIGDQGSHYKLIWAYTYVESTNTWSFELLDAKCH